MSCQRSNIESTERQTCASSSMGQALRVRSLAYWLLKSGHDVLLVEQAPTLRTGGYVIDFWGIGYTIAQEMGLLPRIAELGYQVKEMRYVNRRGRKSGGFPVAAFAAPTGGRYTQLRRSDLAATIYQALDGKAQTLFGDSVAGIADHGDFVRVTFDRAQPREADLVVGADGLHSRVRRLAFSDEPNFEVPLGYHVAALEVAGYRPREDLVAVSHAAPGRQITPLAMPDDKTLFLFVFRDEYLAGRHPDSATASKSVLTRVFCRRGLGGPGDSWRHAERHRHLLRQRQSDPDGQLDKRTHGAGRRCSGTVRVVARRRRHRTCHGRRLCARSRTRRAQRQSRGGFCSLRRTPDAVSGTQAAVGGQACVLVRATNPPRHRAARSGHAAVGDSLHGQFPRGSADARRHRTAAVAPSIANRPCCAAIVAARWAPLDALAIGNLSFSCWVCRSDGSSFVE